MKLSYRGANYEYDIPTVDMMDGEVAGKYRGQNWNYRYPRHMTVPRQGNRTIYRSGQHTREPEPKADEVVRVAQNTRDTRAGAAAGVQSAVGEVAKVHRANICNILDRRKQIAAAKGDESLLRLLEIEWKQMAC